MLSILYCAMHCIYKMKRKLIYYLCFISIAHAGSGNNFCIEGSHCARGACTEDGCMYGCDDGYFGRYCSNTCNLGCQDNKCNRQGECEGGCLPGNWGKTCALTCLNKCTTCEKTNGALCLSCNNFEYGNTCDSSCRENCPVSGCDLSGECIQNCSVQLVGRRCPTACGVGCKRCVDNVCEACHVGYKGADCNIYCINCINCTDEGCPVCKKGYFGDQCQSRCNANCLDGECFQTNPTCTHGCKAEYYGLSCELRCNEHCKGGVCDRKTGKCTEGCVDGYYGQYCLSECRTCRNKKCDSTSGECHFGCQQEYYGKLCRKACECQDGYCTRFEGKCLRILGVEVTTPGDGFGRRNHTVRYIAIGSCGFLAVLLVVGLLIWRYQKRKADRKVRSRYMSFQAQTSVTSELGLVTRAQDYSEIGEI